MNKQIDESKIPTLKIEWVPASHSYNIDLGDSYIELYRELGSFNWRSWADQKIMLTGYYNDKMMTMQDGYGRPLKASGKGKMKIALKEKRALR